MNQLAFCPAWELAGLVARGEVSPLELVRGYLERIERLDGRLRSFITVCPEQALAEAAALEKARRDGRAPGPLCGVPIGLKDLFSSAGVATTAGSTILRDFVPAEDATVVARLRAAGAIVLGKLNMHEFAYGPEGRNEVHGDPRNPWDPRVHRIAGGSSSGSAVAVAAGLCAAALGSDTGGSIRLPAAFCNVTGLKPTYGRVSRAGVLPLAWSMDHAGPMTRTARDAALFLQAMAGPDAADPTASAEPVPDFLAALDGQVAGLRVGLLRPFFLDGSSPAVRAAVESAAGVLASLGAIVEETAIPGVAHSAGAFLAVVWPEALAYHQRWLETRPGDYSAAVRDRLRLGHFVSAVEHLDGQRVRHLLRAETTALLRRFDVLLAPAAPIVASALDDHEIELCGQRRDRRGALILFTQPFNLTGHPACTVPCGFDPEGMPIGAQLVGRAFDEATVLRVADAFQRVTDFHERRPPV